jgi:hypothetical protein
MPRPGSFPIAVSAPEIPSGRYAISLPQVTHLHSGGARRAPEASHSATPRARPGDRRPRPVRARRSTGLLARVAQRFRPPLAVAVVGVYPPHTSYAQASKLKSASGRRSRAKVIWISVADREVGSWGVLWYQGMSRVCPGCLQITPREAREGVRIWNAYGKHQTLNLEPRTSNLEKPGKATQSHIKATPKLHQSHRITRAHGVRMAYGWRTYGVRMVYVWCTYGVRMVYVWCTYGVRSHQQATPKPP